MKRLATCVLIALVAGCTSHTNEQSAPHHTPEAGHAGHGVGGTGGMLMVETEPADAKAGQPATLRLMIHDASGEMVKNFELLHEKKVHLIVVREGLDQFAHLHPKVETTGNMTAAFTFPTGGKYRFYADYQAAGKDPATARGELDVVGDASLAPKLTPNAPGEVEGDGLKAEVQIKNARPGEAARIGFRLTDMSGRPITDLEPYLGALGHLVVISADGNEYVHAHPADDPTQGQVEFEAHFGKAGVYKGWGQFQRAGKVGVVPFVMRVQQTVGRRKTS